MPYKSITDLPDNVKSTLTENEQRQWMEVFNSVYAQAVEKKEENPDIHAAKAAWSVTKKSEGIFIYENDLEPGQRWITLPDGRHILVGPGAPSGLKATPSTPKEPQPETRAEYKRKKAAEYRAKAKAAKLGTDEPIHEVGDHTEASHKGTKFKFGGDVNPGVQEEIYKSYSKEIDAMSPAQRAGFSNIEVTTKTDEWSTDGSKGTTGASYDESEGKITLYDANAIGPGEAKSLAHYYLAHESGHGVWSQSEDVAWGNAFRGIAPNDVVDTARTSFIDATANEGRLTDYADAWYKSNPGRGRDENFAEATKLFTDPDSKDYYINKYPKTYESWKNLMGLMDKEAQNP